MARYYLHVQDGEDVVDQEGEDLPDLKAVHRAALRALSQVLASREESFWRDGSLRIVVQDHADRVVCAIETRDVTDEAEPLLTA